MVFVRRTIRFSVSGDGAPDLGLGSSQALFSTSQSGLRISARVSQIAPAEGAAGNSATADLLVYGLTFSDMNSLARYAWQGGVFSQPLSYLTIEAGDGINGMSKIFYGSISQAWPDFQGAPIIPFHIVAQGGAGDSLQPMQPISFDGQQQASAIASQIAGQMPGVTGFKDLGVMSMLQDQHFDRGGTPGAYMSQLAAAAQAGFTNDRGTLLFWPKNGVNSGGFSPTITPRAQQGQWQLIGYPGFSNKGVLLKCEFYRALDYLVPFTVSGSVISAANGSWKAVRIDYDLESETPKGHWWVTLEGVDQHAPVEH